MQPRWYKGKDKEEAKAITVDFKQAIILRERMVELLKEDIEKSLKEMREAVRAGVPNLTEFYTDCLSKQRTLKDVIKLISEN